MSSVVPFPSIETAAWSQLELQHKQNGQATEYTPQHRVVNSSNRVAENPQDRHHHRLSGASDQAYPASTQSVDLQNLVIPELPTDNFSFEDYLTPEYSQDDNAFSTPEIQDLAWQATYNVRVDRKEEDSNPIDTALEASNTLQSAVSTDSKVSSHNLPSPQLTATPVPPDYPGHSKQSSLSSNIFSHSPVTAFQPAKRSLASVDTTEPNHILTGTGAHSMRNMGTQAISPVIRVDSPALEPVQDFQDSNQRNQQSGPSRPRNETLHRANEQRTGLMPPSQQGDDDWEDEETERAGVAPDARNAQLTSSINDIAQEQERAHTVESVTTWLARTNMHIPVSAETPNRQHRNRLQKDRLRSRSTGSHTEVRNVQAFSDNHVPGPGVLIDEESTYYYSDGDDDNSEAADTDADSAERASTPPTEFPPVQDIEDEDVAPDEQAPLPKQFLRRGPWQDTVRYPWPVSDSRIHPESSNAAMALYDRQAARWETASRAATWGTGRRASESEIASIRDEGKTRHLSLSQKTRVRGTSFMQEARNAVHNLIPRRSNSNAKKAAESSSAAGEAERVPSPGATGNKSPTSGTKTGVRRPSFHRQKSPSTSSAFLAMTGNLTAVGASGSGVNLETDLPKSPLLKALNLKRTRSKSEVPKSPQSTSGVSELHKQPAGISGGSLASPLRTRGASEISQEPTHQAGDLEMSNNTGIRMDLSVYESNASDIIPTLEGFKIHAQGLNPRLPPFLIERIGQDQVRRYKRLLKSKIDHKRTVEVEKRCQSGQHCLALGGEVKLFPPRTSVKDPSSNGAQFKVTTSGDSEVDEGSFDGVVTPALFPDGIPLPPTKRLPAEFECPLCFQVKSFQKPSDWTKHVHEDVQPFSCTFPNCPDPKSFKRKADWVRHENERHRHLEWWQCNLNDCTHVCYRKDNFVQHLVREHKKKEPKGKGRGASTSSKAKGKGTGPNSSNGEELAFWNLVESCRCESTSDPRHEACKFCGNTCATWKKLSVHVGKHMEQIAMPVLELVKTRMVTKDTTLSPVEQSLSRMPNQLATETLGPDPNALSPFTVSATSNYQSSSAGHSPAPMHVRPQRAVLNTNTYYNSGMMASDVHSAPISASPYGAAIAFNSNTGYETYATYPEHAQYSTFSTHTATYPPAQVPHGAHQQLPRQPQHHPLHVPNATPRSQPMETSYTSMPMEGMPAQYYNNGQAFYSSPEIEHSYMHNYGGNMVGGGNMMGGPVSSPMEVREASMGSSQGMQDEYPYPGPSNAQHGYFG